MTRRRFVLCCALVLIVTGVVGTTLWARAGARPDGCAFVESRADARAAVVTGSGPDVLVVGDSYSVGAGLRPDQSWPVRLSGRVRVDGFSGSGFSRHASACGDQSYATRIRGSLRPGTRLVVVEGGLNDYDQPVAELRSGFDRLVRELHGRRLLVVGPPPAPARPAGTVAAVDATLARLAVATGTPYLSMVEVRLTYQADRLHPDAAGQRVFGDAVAAHIRTLLAAG
ncbi:SGNH/GDSL hydrolase family protein [Nocardioides ginsengisoli]|uniref:SGNH/GDSL hydrolase family protein n=1 Tax=Nocardioides ginsengisoli TaxID=363868 RepID=A0ABW3W3E8_9ACTN